MAEETNNKIERKRTPKETASFLFRSIYKNQPALEENERGWIAIIIFIISIVLTVTGIMVTNLNSNASGIASTSSDTAIDIGLRDFSADLDKKGGTNTIYIEDSKAYGTGDFAYRSYSTTVMAPNATYTYGDDNATILRVWTIDLDPVGNSTDNTNFTSFVKKSVYLYETSYDSASSGTTAASWTPSTFLIFTRTSVYIETYKVSGATSSSSAITTIYGALTRCGNVDIYDYGHDSNGAAYTNDEIVNNFLVLFNSAYDSIKYSQTWYYVGVYGGICAVIVLLCALVFWLLSRGKSSLLHFSFWRSFKICSFYAFTPAVITMIFSFFVSYYTPFIFLMVMALRIMTATQRLSGGSSTKSDQPVYKARS